MNLFKRTRNGILKPGAAGYNEATWYCRFWWHGVEYKRNTGHTDKAKARTAARILREQTIAAAWQQLDPKQQTTPKPTATIGELVDQYARAGMDVDPQTVRAYTQRLLFICRAVHPDRDPRTQPVQILNADLPRLYVATATATLHTLPTDAARNSLRRTINSTLRQARCLFTPRAQAHYQAAGLLLPDLGPFLNSCQIHHFNRIGTSSYSAPAKPCIDAMLAGWTHLPRPQALAAGLSLAFGLRRGELLRATWGWLTLWDGVPCINAVTRTKGRHDRLLVRALDPFYTTLLQLIIEKGWRGADAEPIFERRKEYTTFSGLSKWLISLGWPAQSGAHALRDYSGSQIIMRYGPYEAQKWLRHSSVKVTEDSYSTFTTAFKGQTEPTAPVTWATGPTEALKQAS